MKEFIGTLDGIIFFPENINNDKEKCNQLLDQLIDKFLDILEENSCTLCSVTEIKEAN